MCVNAVLDVTPRKLGRLGWRLGKANWDKATSREVKQLRGELEALKAHGVGEEGKNTNVIVRILMAWDCLKKWYA